MKLLVYSLMLVLTMGGLKKCDKEIEGPSAKLSEAFELEIDKTILIRTEKIGITFSKNQESRCPVGVSCIRAGEAKASFQVTNNEGSSETVVLEMKGSCSETDGSCGESKTVMGYTIELITLNPYPGSDAAKRKDPLTAKLKVTK